MVKVKPILQATQSECGLVCAVMILNAYGSNVTVPQIRKITPVGRDGLNLKKVREIFVAFKFDVHIYRFSDEYLTTNLSYPSILLWNNNHYVILKGVNRKYVTIIDPAYGLITLKHKEFREHASVFFNRIDCSVGVATKIIPLACSLNSFLKYCIKSYLYLL